MPTPRLTSSTAATIPLPDADGSTDGLQVDLAVGPNTIKVKVTAEDTSTVLTYTVTDHADGGGHLAEPARERPGRLRPRRRLSTTVVFQGDMDRQPRRRAASLRGHTSRG